MTLFESINEDAFKSVSKCQKKGGFFFPQSHKVAQRRKLGYPCVPCGLNSMN